MLLLTIQDATPINDLIEDGIDLDKRPVLLFLLAENMRGLFDFANDLGYRELERGLHFQVPPMP